MEQIVEQIHDLRKEIDACIQRIEGGYVMRTSETTRALRSFEMAKGWLGKAFAFMELESPYKVASKPEDIPETADRSLEWQEKADHTPEGQVLGVNEMRERIKESLLPGLKKIRSNEEWRFMVGADSEVKVGMTFTLCWKHLHEASMNLGFELQRIRRESVTDSE